MVHSHFSETAKPLVKLTEKNRPFHWNEEQEKDLKDMLGWAQILVHLASKGEFVLDMDTSNEGMEAILSQIQDGQERVVAFGSKMPAETERN